MKFGGVGLYSRAVFEKLPSLIAYVLGMAGLFVADFLISRFFDVDSVSRWAFIKSVLLLAAAVGTLGLDQVIVRNPEALNKIIKLLIPRVTLVSSVIAGGLALSGAGGFFFWFFCVVNVLGQAIAFAVLRGAYQMTAAQFSLNGWKLILLLSAWGAILNLYEQNIEVMVGGSLFFSTAITSVAFLNKKWISFYRKEWFDRKKDTSSSELLLSARGFFFLGISLGLSLNLDQIFLNALDLKAESATLLAHSTIFTPAIVFLNGFVAFYLGPYLRRVRESLTRPEFEKWNRIYFLVGLAFSLISVVLGWAVFSWVYDGKYELNVGVALLLTMLGFIRFLYAVPSAFIGVISGAHDLTRFSKINLVSVALAVAMLPAISHFETSPVVLVLLVSIINWSSRVIYGYILISRHFQFLND